MKKAKMKTLPKLHLCCAIDCLRPVMQHVLITKEEITASDSHILIVFNTNEIFDEVFVGDMPDRFLIHKDNWKILSQKHYGLQLVNNQIELFVKGRSIIIPIVLESNLRKFPEYDKLFKPLKKCAVNEIGISAKLLNTLAQAIGTNRLELNFKGKERAIIVKSGDIDGFKALIMPQRID